jgi:hypothetical protein
MKQLMITALGAVLALLATLSAPALTVADDDIKATLRGFEEPPAVSTVATGGFRGEISQDSTSISFTLSYSGLEGDVTQAHIHLGQRSVNGGISIWLCGTTTNPGPQGTPTCPGPTSGEVLRTVSAADVIGPAGQGIAAGEFQEILKAMREGVTYANVHSTKHPGGEIRGQIKADDDDD